MGSERSKEAGMTEAFEWAVPGRVVFGAGEVKRLGERVGELGVAGRVLWVTGKEEREGTRAGRLALVEAGFEVVRWEVEGEPTLERADAGANLAKQRGCRAVVAVGGGSVVDAGKAVAALAANPGEARDYVEVVGRGRVLEEAPLPFVAVPTTAGTGAEATRNAVLLAEAERVKVSLRHWRMLPVVALIDPALAVTVPREVTVATGMDALTQLLEAYVCKRANPMTDMLCAEGVRRMVRSIQRAVECPGDVQARGDLAMGAWFSGMALANAGLGAVHGFAAPLGGRFGAAHGAVCAALLPAVWEVNLGAVQREGCGDAEQRFQTAAVWLTGRPDATAWDGVEWLQSLASKLAVPGLQDLGVRREDWDELLPLARRASSMRANPVELGDADLRRCLELAG